MRRPLALLTSALALGAVVLSGCGGAGLADATPPAERLEDARAALDTPGSVTLEMTSDGTPTEGLGLVGAQGDAVVSASEPRFQGSLSALADGPVETFDVVAVGDATYVRRDAPDFQRSDLSRWGAPNPAGLFHPETGISALLTATVDPVAQEDTTDRGGEVLQHISGTIPGQRIQDLLDLGDGTGDFAVTWGLTDHDQLRTAVVTGPFFPGSTSTYTLVISDYRGAVDITAPPAVG